jgi:hypothetical protein
MVRPKRRERVDAFQGPDARHALRMLDFQGRQAHTLEPSHKARPAFAASGVRIGSAYIQIVAKPLDSWRVEDDWHSHNGGRA